MSGRRKMVTWRTVGPIVPVVVVLTVAAAIWYAFDKPPDLPGEELQTLIVGNTLDGLWGEGEVPYRQYVADDGTTRMLLNGNLSTGTWSIDEQGAYCAVLPTGEAGCYRARQQNGIYFWIDAEKSLGYPFRVLPGEQLTAETADQTSQLMRPIGGARKGLGDHAGF